MIKKFSRKCRGQSVDSSVSCVVGLKWREVSRNNCHTNNSTDKMNIRGCAEQQYDFLREVAVSVKHVIVCGYRQCYFLSPTMTYVLQTRVLKPIEEKLCRSET